MAEMLCTLVAWMIVIIILATPTVVIGNMITEKIRKK